MNWYLDTAVNHNTVSVLKSALNVDIFALYIFSGNSRFLNISDKHVHCENYFHDNLPSHLFLKREF